MDYSLHHWIQFSAGTEEVVKTYTSYRKVSSKNGRLPSSTPLVVGML